MNKVIKKTTLIRSVYNLAIAISKLDLQKIEEIGQMLSMFNLENIFKYVIARPELYNFNKLLTAICGKEISEQDHSSITETKKLEDKTEKVNKKTKETTLSEKSEVKPQKILNTRDVEFLKKSSAIINKNPRNIPIIERYVDGAISKCCIL